MEASTAMRPQDIALIIQIAISGSQKPTMPMLARSLRIGTSEVSRSIARSRYSGLLISDMKVARQAFLEFLKHGLPYIFPARPGGPARGLPTATAHPDIQHHFPGHEVMVWPHANGTSRGFSIIPLYGMLPEAALANEQFYLAMSWIELFRVGRARERAFAAIEISNILKS